MAYPVAGPRRQGGGVPGAGGDADAECGADPELGQSLQDADLESAAGRAAGEDEADAGRGAEEIEGRSAHPAILDVPGTDPSAPRLTADQSRETLADCGVVFDEGDPDPAGVLLPVPGSGQGGGERPESPPPSSHSSRRQGPAGRFPEIREALGVRSPARNSRAPGAAFLRNRGSVSIPGAGFSGLKPREIVWE